MLVVRVAVSTWSLTPSSASKSITERQRRFLEERDHPFLPGRKSPTPQNLPPSLPILGQNLILSNLDRNLKNPLGSESQIASKTASSDRRDETNLKSNAVYSSSSTKDETSQRDKSEGEVYDANRDRIDLEIEEMELKVLEEELEAKEIRIESLEHEINRLKEKVSFCL